MADAWQIPGSGPGAPSSALTGKEGDQGCRSPRWAGGPFLGHRMNAGMWAVGVILSRSRCPREGGAETRGSAGGSSRDGIWVRLVDEAGAGGQRLLAGASYPGTALSAPHRPGPGPAGTATHLTPSLRVNSSWSGSPLRWKTAITPLWMLRWGEERCAQTRDPPSPRDLLPPRFHGSLPARLGEQTVQPEAGMDRPGGTLSTPQPQSQDPVSQPPLCAGPRPSPLQDSRVPPHSPSLPVLLSPPSPGRTPQCIQAARPRPPAPHPWHQGA